MPLIIGLPSRVGGGRVQTDLTVFQQFQNYWQEQYFAPRKANDDWLQKDLTNCGLKSSKGQERAIHLCLDINQKSFDLSLVLYTTLLLLCLQTVPRYYNLCKNYNYANIYSIIRDHGVLQVTWNSVEYTPGAQESRLDCPVNQSTPGERERERGRTRARDL